MKLVAGKGNRKFSLWTGRILCECQEILCKRFNCLYFQAWIQSASQIEKW